MIPNAVDAARFTPNPGAQPPGRITVVAMSRLVYRKGIDLIAHVIPEMCRRIPNMDFILGELHGHLCLGEAPPQKPYNGIPTGRLQTSCQAWTSAAGLACAAGGDGPKAHVLEHMVQQHSLQDRVRLVGAVSHAAVRSFLVQVAPSLHSPVGCRLIHVQQGMWCALDCHCWHCCERSGRPAAQQPGMHPAIAASSEALRSIYIFQAHTALRAPIFLAGLLMPGSLSVSAGSEAALHPGSDLPECLSHGGLLHGHCGGRCRWPAGGCYKCGRSA